MRAAYSTNSNSINESGVPQCMIWVASLSSGHVCEYRASDLIFADGSSLDSLPRAAPAGPFALEDFHSEPPAATALPPACAPLYTLTADGLRRTPAR